MFLIFPFSEDEDDKFFGIFERKEYSFSVIGEEKGLQ